MEPRGIAVLTSRDPAFFSKRSLMSEEAAQSEQLLSMRYCHERILSILLMIDRIHEQKPHCLSRATPHLELAFIIAVKVSQRLGITSGQLRELDRLIEKIKELLK